MKKYLLILFVSLFVIHSVSAHGLATSKQQVIDKYLVEFEYDTPGNLIAGDYQNYNFDILDANTKQFINFGHAFVRFAKKNGDVVEVADLIPTQTLGAGLDSARLGTVFANAGDYTLQIYFFDKDDKQMAVANYDFSVAPKTLTQTVGGERSLTLDASLICGGLIAGLILTSLIRKYKKHPHKKG